MSGGAAGMRSARIGRASMSTRCMRFCKRSYWAPDTTRDVVERSIDGSLVFGVYDADGAQVGFARVITDYATFAYMADVFIHEDQRGQPKPNASGEKLRFIAGSRKANPGAKPHPPRS